MPIQKRIFTVWLSPPGKETPKLVQRCIESQKIPGYEHIVITMENCYKGSSYVNECLEEYYKTDNVKFLVKASDYLRVWHVWNESGIYLDADMLVLPGKNFDDLLDNRFFTENEVCGNTANAGFGAEKGHPFLKEYMRRVEDNFKGGGDMVYDPGIRAFSDLMWITNKEEQGIKIYPTSIFFPYNHTTEEVRILPDTKVVHFFMGTWYENPNRRRLGLTFNGKSVEDILEGK